MRYVMIGVLVLVLLGAGGRDVGAQQCLATAVPAGDMAGTYVSVAERMRVDVAPCGGVLLTWDNPYGRHQAVYGVTERLAGGGVVARGLLNDGFYLDGQTAIGVKPAEPGFVQVLTVSPYGDNVHIYRLEKIG